MTEAPDPYSLGDALEGFVLFDGDREASAEVRVDPSGVTARGEDGGEVALGFGGLRVRRRGDGAVVVRHRGKPAIGSHDERFLRALETAGGNELNEELARLAGEKTALRGCHAVGCVVFFLLIGLFIYSIPGCFQGAIEGVVGELPFEVDRALGEAAFEAMEGDVVEDPAIRGAVVTIVDRLAPHAGRDDVDWTVRVVRGEDVNAFALPGGFVTVYTGLLEAADEPEMVAGVLAHEMAHVTERHGLQRVAHQLGTFAALQLLLGNTDGLAGLAREVLTIATVNDYSRAQETEADLVGVRTLVAASVDPEALAAFFALLEERYGDVPAGLSWYSTHPRHVERTEAIREEAARLGPTAWEPIEVDWSAIRATLGG